MVDENIQQWVKICEGLDLNTYTDTTGHLTIGWGHNLENGIRLDEAELIFQNDLKEAVCQLEKCTWYTMQSDNVKNALINMNFNLGIYKLSQFKKMISALERRDYTTAASEALDSKWAIQVSKRAKDIAVMIRQG